MARKNLSERRAEKIAQLAALEAEIASLEEAAAKRLGKLAVRAGLADLDLKEAELLREFAAIAARFRGQPEIAARETAHAAQQDGPIGEAARHGR